MADLEESTTRVGTGPRLRIAVGVVFVCLLPLTAIADYLLFHTLAEIAVVVTALLVLVMAWTLRPFLADDFPIFLGTALAAVALLHILHLLDFPGMNVLSHGYDPPTQLWVAARFIFAVSMVIAPFTLGRRLRLGLVAAVYIGVDLLVLASIYWWKVFPSTLQAASGLTDFKRMSEYVICGLFVAAIVLLHRRRAMMPSGMYRWLAAALAASIVTELLFTIYREPDAWANLSGHVFLVLSAVFVYIGVIEDGLARPHAAIVRSLGEAQRLHARLESSLLPRGPVARSDVKVAMHYRPSVAQLELSGDFLDVLDLGVDGLAVICGDVSGHGPDPAALGAMLRVSWQALVRSGVDPVVLVESLRSVVLRERRNPETFVTMCLAWIAPDRDELRLLNIGHPPPLVIGVPRRPEGDDVGDRRDSGPGDVHEISTVPLVPLGSLEVPVPDPDTIALPPDWQLFFYTDGLVEGRLYLGETERYGEERLTAELGALGGTSLDEAALAGLVERIEAAGAGSFVDDVTVVVISKTPGDAAETAGAGARS